MKNVPLTFVSVFFTLSILRAEIKLPAVISDHAMIQASKPVAIWGSAKPEAKVTVIFAGADGKQISGFNAITDSNGKWSGHLGPLKSGTLGEIQVTSDKRERKTVFDVLVGEVWLGGGQSNMVYSIAGKSGADPTNPVEVAEVAHNIAVAQKEAANLLQPIRYFGVTSKGADTPTDDVQGVWVKADAKSVPDFSAVAWNFAVAVQKKLHAPVGLVVSCVGGTPVEAWMSREAIEKTPAGAAVFERHRKAVAAATPEIIQKHDAEQTAWEKANPTPELQFKNSSTKPKPVYVANSSKGPDRLYNGMIHGLQPYTLRGIIWFQADGNNAHPPEYGDLFQGLIQQWRADWKERLPFYFVEMNNMTQEKPTKPVHPHALCLVREQQHAGLALPNTGMVAAIDLGTKNAHFPNKKPVGERLAGLALAGAYHLSVGQVNSPMFKGFAIEGNQVRLKFTDAESLRVRGGGELKGFAIRGKTGDWAWATGKVDGQEIVVGSDQVPEPVAVRYGWAANPVISVENGAGLPLYPFRTDTESKE